MTAEETYMWVQTVECPKVNNLTLPEEWQLNAMRAYGYEVAKRTLQGAAKVAEVYSEIISESILEIQPKNYL